MTGNGEKTMVEQRRCIIVRKLMFFEKATRISVLFAYSISQLDRFEYKTDLPAFHHQRSIYLKASVNYSSKNSCY